MKISIINNRKVQPTLNAMYIVIVSKRIDSIASILRLGVRIRTYINGVYIRNIFVRSTKCSQTAKEIKDRKYSSSGDGFITCHVYTNGISTTAKCGHVPNVILYLWLPPIIILELIFWYTSKQFKLHYNIQYNPWLLIPTIG